MVVDDSKSSRGMLRQEDCRKPKLKPAGQSEFLVSSSYIKPCFLLLLLFLHLLQLQKSRLGERRERYHLCFLGDRMCVPLSNVGRNPL